MSKWDENRAASLTQQNIAVSYRPDIDGLRAVAVLAVVLFHFGVEPFDAGFVGVDVFFVISGFLITGLVHKEIVEERFSLSEFYVRRIKRILPALLVVTLCTLGAGAVLLLPSDLVNLTEQSAYAIVGLSNFHFSLKSGYFDRAAEFLPLLHTWSLGVEEQFYLFWPALMMFGAFVSRGRRGMPELMILSVVLASLAFSVLKTADDQTFAFFMLPTRAWQLGLGGLLVWAPALTMRWQSETLRIAGFALIAFGVTAIDPEAPYPGINALIPTIGAALIIWPSLTDSAVSKLLSLRAVISLGLISYSLYLWHWPIVTFYRFWANGKEPSLATSLWLILLSIVLSVLTWRFVEQPARRSSLSNSRIFLQAGCAIVAVITIGGALRISGGLPQRFDEETLRIASYLDYKRPKPDGRFCSVGLSPKERVCLSAEYEKPKVALIGDSHATPFLAPLVSAFPNLEFFSFRDSGCRPVLNTTGKASCVELVQSTLEEVVPAMNFDAIIVVARWRNGESEFIGETVAHLSSHTGKVIVFGQTMEYRTDLPAFIVAENLPRKKIKPKKMLKRYDKLKMLDVKMRQDLSGLRVQYFSTLDTVCPDGECKYLTHAGVPFAWDYGHLTMEGATSVLSDFRSQGLELP